MQVAKWGNSLAVRLPVAVVEALKLKEGDDIEIHLAGERSFDIARSASSRELLAQLRALLRRTEAIARGARAGGPSLVSGGLTLDRLTR